MIKWKSLVLSDQDNDEGLDEPDVGTITKTKPKTQKPAMYKVLLLNDDFTPMEFVVHVLQSFFGLTVEQSTEIMLQVHTKGVGICGVFTFEVAEMKVLRVCDYSKKNEHPLKCTLEKD